MLLGSDVAHSVLLRDVQRVDCGGAAARGASADTAGNKSVLVLLYRHGTQGEITNF